MIFPGSQVAGKNSLSHHAVSEARTKKESPAIEPVKKRMRIVEGAITTSLHTEVTSQYSYNQGTHIESLNNPAEDKTNTRRDKELLTAEDFLASLGKPEVTLQVRIPNDPSQIAWNFYGQILSMKVHVMTKIKDVKSELSRRHLNGMPPNKIQLRDTIIGFMKDGSTLASLNIGPTATVEMIPKTRGGRK